MILVCTYGLASDQLSMCSSIFWVFFFFLSAFVFCILGDVVGTYDSRTEGILRWQCVKCTQSNAKQGSRSEKDRILSRYDMAKVKRSIRVVNMV